MLEKTQEEERNVREKVEQRLKDLEKSHLRLIQELETRSQEAHQWEMKSMDLEKRMNEFAETAQNQEKILQANYRQLEMREKELENARRQLRDINAQMEQRDAIQRRTRLAGELTEKETRLKGLVHDQEKIEAEIREKEEVIRKILSEQEKVEKDIIESKQAQRHLSEILKRTNPKSKLPGSTESASSEENLPETND